MYENIGSCFSALRKAKHIPVADVIGDSISHSQYHRFINNESDVSVTKFLYMIDQINITLEEFVFLAFAESDPLKQGMKEIKKAFETKNLSELEKLSNKYKDIYKNKKQIKFQHLGNLCDSLISRIDQSKSIPQGFLDLKKYLVLADTWGHYELVLFNNIFFLFDEDTVYTFFKRAKKISIAYQPMNNYMNELIKLNSNLIIYFIERNNVGLAVEVINEFSQLELINEQIYEKSLVKFWTIIKLYLLGDKNKAIKEFAMLQEFMKFIHNESYGKLLQGIFEFVQNNF